MYRPTRSLLTLLAAITLHVSNTDATHPNEEWYSVSPSIADGPAFTPPPSPVSSVSAISLATGLSGSSRPPPGRNQFESVRATPPPNRISEPPDDPSSTSVLEKRWVDLCEPDCRASTGVTSFRAATKSLTDDCREYSDAKKTVVKSKKKKVKTVDGCKTTVTKKVKHTMYVLWVRQEEYASHSLATKVGPPVAAIALSFLVGAILILWQQV